MTSGGLGVAAEERTDELTDYITVQIEKGLVAMAPTAPSHVRLTKMSNKLVHLQKRVILSWVANSSIHTTTTKGALLENDPETLDAGQYKLPVYKKT